MKKYFYGLMVALMTITAFAFVSCSDDDDVELSANSIVGTWSVEGGNVWGIDASMTGSVLGDSFWIKEYIRFYEDGSFVDVVEDQIGDEYELDIRYGTWTLDGNDLVLRTNGSNSTVTYTVNDITNDKMTVTVWGIKSYLVRVSDSVIDAYLEEYDDDDEL